MRRSRATPEYEADGVRLVRTAASRPVRLHKRDPDLTKTSVRAWVRQAEIEEGKGRLET